MISAVPVHRERFLGWTSDPLQHYHFAHPILPTIYTIMNCWDNLFFILNCAFLMASMFIMLCYCMEKLEVGHVRLRKGPQQLLKVRAGARLKFVRSFVGSVVVVVFCCGTSLLDIVTASFGCNVFDKLNSVYIFGLLNTIAPLFDVQFEFTAQLMFNY